MILETKQEQSPRMRTVFAQLRKRFIRLTIWCVTCWSRPSSVDTKCHKYFSATLQSPAIISNAASPNTSSDCFISFCFILLYPIQVNAGAGEVARVFLSPTWSPPSPQSTPIPLQSPTTPHTVSSKSSTLTTPMVAQSSSRDTKSVSPSTSVRSNAPTSSKSSAVSEKASNSTDVKKDESDAERDIRVQTEKRALIALGESQKLKLKVRCPPVLILLSVVYFSLAD